MNIGQLLQNMNNFGDTRTPSYTFSNKLFGKVYINSDIIRYKPRYGIVEINTFITAVTQKDRSIHRIAIALKGLNMQVMAKNTVLDFIKFQGRGTDTDEDLSSDLFNNKELISGSFILPIQNDPDHLLVIKKEIPLSTEIRCKCTCADYYFTFEWENAKNGVNIGVKPPPYKNFKGVRNPKHLPGLCKHLMLVIALLMNNKILGANNQLTKAFRTYKNRAYNITNREANRQIKELGKQIKVFNKKMKNE